MITYEMIKEAQDTLVEEWGIAGKRVIEECARVHPFNSTSTDFLNHCTAQGGNWGGMILSGIKKLYPNVWDAIPCKMGKYAFLCLCDTLVLCGVDVSK